MTNRPFPSDIFFAHSIPIPITPTPRQHSTPGQLLNNVPLPFFVTFIIPFPVSPSSWPHPSPKHMCLSIFQRVTPGTDRVSPTSSSSSQSPKNSSFLSFTVLLPEPPPMDCFSQRNSSVFSFLKNFKLPVWFGVLFLYPIHGSETNTHTHPPTHTPKSEHSSRFFYIPWCMMIFDSWFMMPRKKQTGFTTYTVFSDLISKRRGGGEIPVGEREREKKKAIDKPIFKSHI